MNVQIDQLVKSLLEKDSLENCSLQEVKEYADRHPHFGAAQLLLTKKLQIEKAEEYDEQLQKTFLFFHNPLWVKKLLNDTGDATIIEKEKELPVENFQDTSLAEESTELKDHLPNNVVATATIPRINEVMEDETNITDSNSEADNTELPAHPENDSAIVLPTFKFEPVDPSKSELLFEPFHTVDYFASQGINFKEDEKPVDKFDLQLKSFTDWLKTMKKLPVTENQGINEPLAEKKVEQLAEHSIKDRDIVTLTMAEVWEKQGNKDKAIEIYNKLSLLEPSKSPYFAAKIEELKKLN